MAVRIVRLGSKRGKDEGLRIGTVRFLPRGVPKTEYARRDLFDVWFPNLAPSAETLKEARPDPTDARSWSAFVRRYRKEMKAPAASKILGLLAALSNTADFSVGCYCADENRCHRSVLRELLVEHGAKLAPPV